MGSCRMLGSEGMIGVTAESTTLLRKASNLQEARGEEDVTGGSVSEVTVQEWQGRSNNSSSWT